MDEVSTAPILLVEDDENDVLLLQRAFKRANLPYPLQVVRTGNEAIQYLAGEGRHADRRKYPLPFLVLLDLRMPGRDGFEVLRWLRATPGLEQILAVVLTSSEADPDVIKAYELGANSYLVKPGGDEAQLEELLKLIERYWPLLKNMVVVRPQGNSISP